MATLAVGGSLTAASPTFEFQTRDAGIVGVEVSGTWTGTITFEARIGNTWANAQVFTVASVSAAATTTANVSRLINAAGFSAVRANFSTPTSGSPTVIFTGSPEGLTAGASGGGAVTIADGADTAEGTTTDAGIITDTSGTVIGFLRGAIKMWITFLSRLPAALVSGRLDVNIGASPATVPVSAVGPLPTTGYQPAAPTCTFTRPANTTPYSIGDEVGTAGTAPTTVTVARVNGGGGIIQGARVFYSSYSATVPQLVLLVFNATATLAGDNAQFSLSDADAAKLVCTIPLTYSLTSQYSASAPVSAGGVWLTGSPDRSAPHFVCGGSEQTLYCCLITLNAFTPIANSETLAVYLDAELN